MRLIGLKDAPELVTFGTWKDIGNLRVVISRAAANKSFGSFNMSMVTVRSYEQGKLRISTLLSGLSTQDAFYFAVWCVSRMPAEFGDVVWDALTNTEKERLQCILDELARSAEQHSILPADRAAELADVVVGFGPQDDCAAIDVDPDATKMRSAVWGALQYCHDGDISHVCDISDLMIDYWDFHAGSYYEGYCLENMFDFLELRRELELQEKFIASLS